MMPAAERCCVERLLCWCLQSVGDFLSWRQRVMDSTARACTVLINGTKQPLPWALLCMLSGVSGTVLLSALYVLLALYVWVNPAFYQWHPGAFTKRISELEWAAQQQSSAKMAAHFYSKINTELPSFCFSQWTQTFVRQDTCSKECISENVLFLRSPCLNDKNSISNQDPPLWFVLLFISCAGVTENVGLLSRSVAKFKESGWKKSLVWPLDFLQKSEVEVRHTI